MNGAALIGTAAQVVLVVAGAPLLVGLMRQVRARLEGRAGPGIGQPWRDVRKLMSKNPVQAVGTSAIQQAAPLVLATTGLMLCAVWGFWWRRTGDREPIVVPIACILTLLTPPGNWFYLNSSPGLFALAGSLILFAMGLVVAWTRHRWDQKPKAP